MLGLVRRYVSDQRGWQVAVAAALVVAKWPILGFTVTTMLLTHFARAVPGRATIYDAALPIPARDLVMARMIARVMLAWIPLVTWVVMSQTQGVKLWSLSRTIELAEIVTLALIVPYGVRSAALHLTAWQAYGQPLALLLVCSVLILNAIPASVGVVVFAIAIVTIPAWTMATMPAAFESAPRHRRLEMGPRVNARKAVDDMATAVDRDAAVVGQRTKWLGYVEPQWAAWSPILRSVASWQVGMMFAFMVIFGATGSWLIPLYIFVPTSSFALRQRTHWLDALPMSHRKRLLVRLVPLCIGSLGGVLIGRELPYKYRPDRDMSATAPASLYDEGHYYSSPTRVPLTYWSNFRHPERVPRGRAMGWGVDIFAPWGERVAADTISILGTMYFNQFTTTKQSSDRFVAWQFANATKAVYGRSISREDYRDKNLPRPRPVTRAWRVQLLGAGLALALMFFILFTNEIAFSRTLSRLRLVQKVALGGLLSILPITVVGGAALYYSGRRVNVMVMPMLDRALLAISRALPPNPILIVLVALLPVVAMYAILEWQFRRSETDSSPMVRQV